MKIVVLDGYTMNPGDNPWDELAALGDLTVHDRTAVTEVAERAGGAEVVLTNKVKLRAKELAELPDLKLIVVTATGYNVVDINAARERGVVVCNAPAYSTNAVAQHVFALLFELTNHVGMHDRAVKAGEWSAAPDWTFWKSPLMELSGKTMGIIGFGQIGRRVGELANAFGMSVLAATRTQDNPPDYQPFAWGSIGDVFSAPHLEPSLPHPRALGSGGVSVVRRSGRCVRSRRGSTGSSDQTQVKRPRTTAVHHGVRTDPRHRS